MRCGVVAENVGDGEALRRAVTDRSEPLMRIFGHKKPLVVRLGYHLGPSPIDEQHTDDDAAINDLAASFGHLHDRKH